MPMVTCPFTGLQWGWPTSFNTLETSDSSAERMGSKSSLENSNDSLNHLKQFWHHLVPENFTFCQGTNGTNGSVIQDMIFNHGNFFGPGPILVDLMATTSSVIGFSMSSIIINYLTQKALGEQSAIDIPVKSLFHTFRLLNVLFTVATVLGNVFIDPGHLLASFISWITFNLVSLMIVFILTISLFQLLKLFNPSHEFSVDDKSLSLGAHFGLIGFMALFTILCLCFNVQPTSYFLFRGFPLPQNCLDIGKIRIVGFIITMTLYYLVRLLVCFLMESLKSSDILGWKIMLIMNLYVFVATAIAYISFKGDYTVSVFSSILFSSSLPFLAVISKGKISEFGIRHNYLFSKTIRNSCTTIYILSSKKRRGNDVAPGDVELQSVEKS